MRTKKYIVCLVLVVAVLVSLCAAASANELSETFKDNSNFIQDYTPVKDGILAYCAAAGSLPDVEDFKVKLGTDDVKVTKVETTKNDPVTYYCLIDVSGSISSLQLLCARQMLHALCESLNEGDQMVIASVGNTVKASDYLSDKDTINAAIEELITQNEDSNLYRAIIDSLEELDTGKNVTNRKCLVVFSDGHDESTAEIGRTQQEAERKISETRIPVYCMFPPSQYQDAGKNLGSLARNSFGGDAYYLADRKLTEEQIGQAISTDMKSDLVLTIDLTGINPQKDELLLMINYTDAQGRTYGDSIKVVASNLELSKPKPAAVTPTAAPTPRPSAAPTPTPTPEPNPASTPKWIIPAAVGVCLALVILVIVLKKQEQKKKEKQKREEEEKERKRQENFRKNMGVMENDLGVTTGGDVIIDGDSNAQTGGGIASHPTLPKRKVRFTSIGNQSIVIDLEIQEGQTVTLGRNGKADIILNADDHKLSGAHFALRLQDDTMKIRDVGSTNGTSVNGVPLVGNAVQIRSGETVTAGNYQYRIQF